MPRSLPALLLATSLLIALAGEAFAAAIAKPNLVYIMSGTYTPCSVIRQGDWKLIQFFEDDSVKLFNLAEDLGEQHDLSGRYKEKTAELLTALKRWQSETKAVIPSTLNPDFDPETLQQGKGGRRNKKKP